MPHCTQCTFSSGSYRSSSGLMISCSTNSHFYSSMQFLRSSLKPQVITISLQQQHSTKSNKPDLAVIPLKGGDSQSLGSIFCISFFILLLLLKFSLQSGFWKWESWLLTTHAIITVTFPWKKKMQVNCFVLIHLEKKLFSASWQLFMRWKLLSSSSHFSNCQFSSLSFSPCGKWKHPIWLPVLSLRPSNKETTKNPLSKFEKCMKVLTQTYHTSFLSLLRNFVMKDALKHISCWYYYKQITCSITKWFTKV